MLRGQALKAAKWDCFSARVSRLSNTPYPVWEERTLTMATTRGWRRLL